MTKRLLSILLAVLMIASCFVFSVSAEEDTRYEGIVYFQAAEDMLSELNKDTADTDLWDNSDRNSQQNLLVAATTAFPADFTDGDLVEKWDAYCDKVLTRDVDGNVINYLKMLDISKKDDAALTDAQKIVKAALIATDEEYDVTDLTLKESFYKLDDYTTEIGAVISANRATLNAYNLTDAKKTEYMLHGTKTLYQIAFENQAEEFCNAFDNKFLGDDEGKKLLAVMYGKALTVELVSDNISDVLVSYINNNFVQIKDGFGALIKAECNEKTAAAVFDFLRNTVSKAYDAYAEATPVQKSDIKMLFGNPDISGDKGALQIMFETLDSSCKNSYGMINVWFNLFLREHVQTSFKSTVAKTLESGADTEENRISLKAGSVVFRAENLDRYGINADSAFLALGSDFLDLVCYNEDHTLNSKVSYNQAEGKITIRYDSTKDSTYPGYIQLVRNDGTYIETYPVMITNPKASSGGGGGGGGGTAPSIKVSYETDGGTKYSNDYFYEGYELNLTKVPVKDGYIFEGWYLDAECTQSADGHSLEDDIVLYANWVKDNGVAGGYQPVPGELNGEDHFAYVIGYPDETVRPENNITRAEVAAIFFRLLKADVREANITETNAFVDVFENEWYNTAVSTLTKLGIINGRTATEFVPNASITRAEFATICARFEDSEYAVTDNFTDIGGHWAELYIREAAARGWIKGYEDATFRPERLITRAESMTLINRMLNRAPETEEDLHEDMAEWIDNPETAWYYLAVQEATNSHAFEQKNNVYEKWTEIKAGTDWTQYQ